MKTKTIKLTDKALIKLRLQSSFESENMLTNYVIDSIMERSINERINFITELLNHGCISGLVSELIYYSDTTKFYARFKSEIFDLADEQAKEIGYTSAMELIANLRGAKDCNCIDQLENLLSWYGFEETARNIAYQLGIEI